MNLPRHWVVVRLSALGDVVLTTGVLAHLHARYGHTFTVLTRSQWAPVFEHHPAVTGVETLDTADLPLQRLWPRFRQLAARHADAGLLDLHGTLRSRLLGLLWQGPVRRYPKLSVERRAFLQSGGKLFRQQLLRWNVPQRYALALESEAPPRTALLPRIWLDDTERQHATALLGAHGSSRPLVALHPYSTHPDKAWSPTAWRMLAEEATTRCWDVVIVGRGDPLHNMTGLDLTNATSLRTTCAILEKAQVLVTGDSGPMHLAGAVQTPVVALFGPTAPEWGFYPEGPEDRVVEMPMDCRPCTLHGSRRCAADHACMGAIAPEHVVAVTQEVLAAQLRKSGLV